MIARLLVVVVLLLAVTLAATAQGLSPKAGAYSEGLYTNLYFGMNYKPPADWKVSFVAMDGECPRECMLLDVRAPGERSRRAITITAELLAGGSEGMAVAGTTLEQMGAKRIAPPKEITVAGRKSYRADYRSQVLSGEVYYSIVALPAKQYTLVFSFSSESRKHLDTMVEELPKAINFVGQT